MFVLNGNGVHVTKHCVHAVSCKKIYHLTSFSIIYLSISIAFRKMDKAKRLHNFKLDPNLQNIKFYDLSDAFES
ncbi:hypothetical protein IEQ34_019978 [Dendrobium chrysotoxum]|uniref:Uncharacterized protein n=1 Tax=Dendrobium chrysotoxum TaxID=161865 RepID=A0AAV7GA21_DENCH|nr:hypothetical protein IEQ34_019978 [Dendrobium chrysotoxum]